MNDSYIVDVDKVNLDDTFKILDFIALHNGIYCFNNGYINKVRFKYSEDAIAFKLRFGI